MLRGQTGKTRAILVDDSLSLDSVQTTSQTGSTSGSTYSAQKRCTRIKFVWKNTWEYMISALGFTVSPWSMRAFVAVNCRQDSCPNIYQYCLTYIFVGMPLVYMYVILGQYTQMGVLHLKYMCPIGHGSAYVSIILIILYISLNTINMADFLMYFLTTLQEKVQWMLCPNNIASQCWSGYHDCKEKCISEHVYLSAHWYWNKTYMDTIEVQHDKKLKLAVPSLPRMISIAFSVALVWFIVVFVSARVRRKMILWIFYFSFLSALALLICVGVLTGSGRGLQYMFAIDDPHVLYNLSAWSHAVSVVTTNLCLGRACQMVYGSYMPSMNNSGIRTLIHVLTNMVMNVLFGMLTYMAIGAITYKAKIDFKDYSLVIHNSQYSELELIVLPQSIGFKYAPQFWNSIYFAMCFCLLLSNQILLQGVFVRCVSDSFSNLVRYTKYIYSALCIFTILISILLISKGIFLFYIQLRSNILIHIELVIMVATSIVILWIYGIKRLSDDLHFITGQQPTKFWKIFWCINPLVLFASIITVNLYVNISRGSLTIVLMIFYFVCTAPIPILGCFEILKYLKKRNLVGLFQPEEIWGPPDPEERIMRHVFNPRKEIKSRRRTETCQHKCLLGSKVLKKVIQEETKAREEKVVIEISDSVEQF